MVNDSTLTTGEPTPVLHPVVLQDLPRLQPPTHPAAVDRSVYFSSSTIFRFFATLPIAPFPSQHSSASPASFPPLPHPPLFSGRAGAQGNKYRMTLGLPVAAVMNCCDNSGAKNLYIISVCGIKGRLNRLPSAGVWVGVGC